MAVDAGIDELLGGFYEFGVPGNGVYAVFGAVAVVEVGHFLFEEVGVDVAGGVGGPVGCLLGAEAGADAG